MNAKTVGMCIPWMIRGIIPNVCMISYRSVSNTNVQHEHTECDDDRICEHAYGSLRRTPQMLRCVNHRYPTNEEGVPVSVFFMTIVYPGVEY